MTISLPLEGIRVAEFGQLIAIPGAAQQLAELGAAVIKVESPEGDPARAPSEYAQAMLHGHNRGKRAIVLDVKDPRGLAAAERLIAGSDVFCHNLRPGTMEKLGLGVARVRELNPRIINVSVSGFGADGPSATRAGLDIAAQAESGLMSMTGEADGDPQRVGAPIIDQATAYQVVQAVLAALFRRERTGEGEDVRVSLLDVAIHLQTPNWVQQTTGGAAMRRKGNGQPTAAPAADVVNAADGQFVLSAYTDMHFRRLCSLIGRPELPADPRFVDNPGRVLHRALLLEVFSEAFSHRAVEDCVRELIDAGLVAAVIRTYDAVMVAPDVTANEVLARATASDGSQFSVPVPPARGSMFDSRVTTGRVPRLGEHTREVLAELGYGHDEIEQIASGSLSLQGGAGHSPRD